ncbi:hypothetical protein [Phascolarctobacterium sp.]
MRRTRTVRRMNYAAAAFYVYVLAMLVFIATNAVVKVMAVTATVVK